ncbi:hypothetical protein [Candidatus Formimonas warabiya]|nr:hypothetical protein [Candidatus Formimonas warabiya]
MGKRTGGEVDDSLKEDNQGEVGLKMGKSSVKVQEIAKAAAREALKLQRDEERQRIRKNRFHNTELLLKNYMSLMDHYENAQDKASEELLESLGCDDMDPDDVIIQSIKRSRVRTRIMINHIETYMEVLRFRLKSRSQEEKYEVIYRLYLDRARRDISWGEKVQIIAEELHCSTDSVRRWKNEMVDELSILLFGIDGLKLEM